MIIFAILTRRRENIQMYTKLGMYRAFLRKIFILIAVFTLSGASLRAQYDTNVFYLRGRQALSDGQYARAIDNFNILAQLDTAQHLTYFFRGIAKYNLGDVRGAAKDFDRSIRLNPVFTSGYHYRAVTSARQGDYEKALEDHNRSIELRPGFMGLYFSRGVTYFMSGQFEKALSDFDRYIRREPSDPSAYLNRGACYLFLADTTKALSDYNKAIKLDRFDPEGYVRRGRLYSAQGDYENALGDLNRSVELDSTNTFAYFSRAIIYYEDHKYQEALKDMDLVLKREPGNALTLYNRSLIYAQLGEYVLALDDMDRVLNINPNNVLAYFNRASIFISMGRYKDARADYTKAIELYPDFAKAYLNRSYVNNLMGRTRESEKDYKTAQQKIAAYRRTTASDPLSFADTTKKYSSLIALDADFAKSGFDNELLQYRDIDIRLKPLFRFALAGEDANVNYALSNKYESRVQDLFISSLPVNVAVESTSDSPLMAVPARYDASAVTEARGHFLKALGYTGSKQYNMAASQYDMAVEDALEEENLSSKAAVKGEAYFKAFYLLNRAVLKADMIELVSKFESNVRTLTMEDSNLSSTRVSDKVTTVYDYSEAIADLLAAKDIVPDYPYIWFNLGNLYCLSTEHIRSLESYNRAIELYPRFGEAYFNRGLVLIFLKDKEKGCIDLSRSGELGVAEAYSVIKKFCDKPNE